MSILTALRTTVTILRARLGAARGDERGQVVQTVLLIAGFGILAVGVIAAITAIVNGIINDVPTSAS